MATRRLPVFLAGALAIGVGAAWVASDFRPVPPAEQNCLVGVPYAVDVQEDQATFDLPFEPGTRYRVILASVGSHGAESQFSLSAEKVPAVERFPLRRVSAIQPPASQKVDTSWKSLQTMDGGERDPAPFVPQSGSTAGEKPLQRTFSLHVTDGPLDDARQYAKVTGTLVAEGRFVRVFLDSQMNAAQLAPGLVSEVVRLFDGEIVPGSRDVLGQFRDIDGDGKFAILISPWLGRLQGGKTSLGGFVRGSDFQKMVLAPFGNRADVLYLNANLQPGPHLKTLLAHEYAHAICFSERLPTKFHPQGLPGEEDWLNEAIAHLAENLHGTGWTNLDHRISRFLDASDRSPLVVRNYYAGGLWRDPGCRGATYLFLRWVVDQFGEEVLPRLIRGRDAGVKNLEAATGVPFPDLFRGWTIALAQAGGDFEGPAMGEFTSLDLNQRLGRWNLQGLRAAEWNLEGGARTFELSGTSIKVFDIQPRTPGLYRLRVRTQGRPGLQVTILRQPAPGPKSKAIARWHIPESPSAHSPVLHVGIESQESSPARIVRLSVECLGGKQGQSICWEADQLAAMPTLPGPEGMILVAALPARLFPPAQAGGTSWLVKVLTQDAEGRQSASWIDLPAPPSPELPLAARPQTTRRTADGG